MCERNIRKDMVIPYGLIDPRKEQEKAVEELFPQSDKEEEDLANNEE
jgi:hypothetical protein